MSLSAGTRLGPYEILSPLGAGGMGEVFRARDTRLGRDVAIKVLPASLSSNPELRARFEREAKTVSSLNHPNICVLHDVGREGEIDFLVMELVEGETLASRLAKGALPPAEVLRLGAQIADALDRAHRAGVVHRDLKPGNVMLTRSGAKLMDFGLARATGLGGPVGSGATLAMTQSPTVAAPLTAEGTIIGTFQYMSPEQLEGKESDARSDIWALGCVLYEMTTGRRAFEGKSQASLIGAIMNAEPPPLSTVAPLAPVGLEHVVRACLAKDPDERIQTAHDAKLQIQLVGSGSSTAGVPMVPVRRSRSRETIAWIGCVLGLAVAAVVWILSRSDGGAPTLRTVVPAPPGATFLFAGDNAGPPILSPDGRRLAFVAVDQSGGARLWVRDLSSLTAEALPGTENATYPFWSADSRAIGFFGNLHLRRVDLATRQVFSICPAVNGRGGTWNRDGVIVFAPDFVSGLMRVSAMGGVPETLTVCDSTRHSTHRWPEFLPDGKHFLYFAGAHGSSEGPGNAIWIGSLDQGNGHELMPSAAKAQFRDGYVFFMLDSVLVARRFDPGSRRFRGAAQPTAERVQFDPTTWYANFSVSDAGLMAYQGVGGQQGSEIQLRDRSGKVLKVIAGGGNHFSVRLSKDGQRVIYSSQVGPNGDLFTYDLERGIDRRLTRNVEDEDIPVWSPDNRQIAFTRRQDATTKSRYDIYVMPSDGVGVPRMIHRESRDVWPVDWSSDGRFLLVSTGNFIGSFGDSLGVLTLDGSRPVQWLDISGDVLFARFSHDGRWIAYCAGREIFVTSNPSVVASGERLVNVQISPHGGELPQWRAENRELCYLRPDGMIVSVALAPGSMAPGPEIPLFRILLRPLFSTLDMTADGERFLVNTLASEGAAPIVVVSNWKRDLEAR